MASDVFGQAKPCLLEMEILFTLLHSLQRVSQKELFLTENCSSAEESSKRLCQLFDVKMRMMNGRTFNISFLTALS